MHASATARLSAPASSSEAIAVYVHWPFCLSKCPYCDFNSHVRDKVDHAGWRTALLTELDYIAARLPGREVVSIFFGGGTPSLMPPETVAAIIERIGAHWTLAPNIEITLEANPTSVEAKNFAALRAGGVNRVSLGVQALHSEALHFLGRHHSVEEALQAVELAASIFPRFSFDLIYARPDQTVQAWGEELAQALRFAGDHLSLYQLTLEPGTAFYHHHQKGTLTLPDDETTARLFERTQEIMDSAGLPAYEISNHARSGEESRHNLVYWRGGEYVGIGPGAHGRLNIDGRRIATEAIKSPERWLEAIGREGHGFSEWSALAPQIHAEERLMMGLRLCEGLALEEFERKTGVAFDQLVAPAKRTALQNHSLLEYDGERLKASPRGRLLLTTLTAELLS